jgi:DNA topoisomerase
MSKILVLAEKPTQGKLYAQALGKFTQKDGYYENDKYIITWAFGHLIELAKDTAYREDGKWDKGYLPLIPSLKDYKYVAKDDSGVKKQLKIIKDLMKEAGEIYCATDSDREGELIFRYIYNYLNCKLPFKRVWIRALEDEEIRKAFAKPEYKQGDSFLENLSKSAYSRAISDWLIGVNGTQSATLQFGRGSLLSIGRVQTTILKIICERYNKNKSHQKSYTYKIITTHNYNGLKYLAESPIFDTKQETEAILHKLSENHIFKSYQKKKDVKKPPLLHTLDSLTIVANKLYKYDASQVLASAQKLYESKLISYPRTEDPYITEEGYKKLKNSLLPLVSKCLNIDNFSFPSQTPASVDGSKITGSHDALIPTGQTAGIENLSVQDRNIFDLILYRCLESFSQEAIYEKGIYTFENNDIPFVTRTNTLLQTGWKKYTPTKKNKGEEDKEEEDKEEEKIVALELPYKEGDKVEIKGKEIREIESKAPSIYTPATLTEDLSNLAKFLQQEDPKLYNSLKDEIDLKSLQIGTKATRPSIIEQLIQKRKFVDFSKNKYTPTELGMKFYESIKDMEVVNVAETAKLEYKLSKVASGEMTEEDFYKGVSEYTRKIVEGVFGKEINMQVHQQDSLGQCPLCKKGSVREGTKAYGCTEYKNGCNFTIWKEIASKKLTKKNVEDLLNKGETSLIKGFKSKAGKDFEAYLYLDEEGKVQFKFPQKK